MPTAIQLKKDIQLNSDLTSILGVIEDIAVSQFHSLDKKKQSLHKLLDAFKGFFSMVNFYKLEHPLVRPQNKNMAILMISSDEGFMGGLNSKVINAALDKREARNAELLIIGTRGAEHLKGLREECVFFPGVDLSKRYELAEKIRDHIMKGVKENRFGRCILSYSRAISFSLQEIVVETLLPCSGIVSPHPDPLPKGEREEIPTKGFKALLAEHEGILIESSLEGLLEYLIGLYIVEKLFLVFEEARLSEYGARANHLEGSCQHLKREGRKIRLQYLKAAHSMVDRSMRETFASQIIKKKRGK